MNEGLVRGPTQTTCSLCERGLAGFSRRRHDYLYNDEVGYFRVCKFCWNAAHGVKSQSILRAPGLPDSAQPHKRRLSYYKREAGRRKGKGESRHEQRREAAQQQKKAAPQSRKRLS